MTQGFDINKFRNELSEKLRNPRPAAPASPALPRLSAQRRQRALDSLNRSAQRRPGLNLGSIRGG